MSNDPKYSGWGGPKSKDDEPAPPPRQRRRMTDTERLLADTESTQK